MDNLKIWHKFLETIKPQVSPANYKAWFSKIKLDSIEDNKVTISAPHAFIRETLNQRHLSLIESTLREILGKKVDIRIIVKEQATTHDEAEEDFFQPVQTKTSL